MSKKLHERYYGDKAAPEQDDDGLAAAAGDMPHRVDVLDRPVQTLGQQIMANKQSTIMSVGTAQFGKDFDPVRVRGHIYRDGREVYQYEGQNFLEIMPLDFESVQDGDSYKITATQVWKTLELET